MRTPQFRWRWGLALVVLALCQAVPAHAAAQDKAPADKKKAPERFAFEMKWSRQPGPGLVELIPLTNLEAAGTAQRLRAIYAGGKDAPFIDADVMRNAIVVRGTAQQLAEVRGLIRELGLRSEMKKN
jgi:type II secretory pathway component GspD/PulD (secretin)